MFIIDDQSNVGESQESLQKQSQKFALERRRGIGNQEKNSFIFFFQLLFIVFFSVSDIIFYFLSILVGLVLTQLLERFFQDFSSPKVY